MSGRAYETTEAPSKVLMASVVIGWITLLALGALVALLNFWFARQYWPPTIATAVVPAQPRLQIDPAADRHRLLDAEEKTLHGYGWIDRANGVARIPIERAMQMALTRIPYHKLPPPPPRQPQGVSGNPPHADSPSPAAASQRTATP